jgi:hypothetical protein
MRPERFRARRTALGLVLAFAGGVAGCYDSGSYTPTESNLEKILTLRSVSGATSLPADGFSRLALEARLLGDPALANRTVVFRTSRGSLDGGTAAADGSQSVAADAEGIARITLISDATPGSAVVTASPMSAPGIAVTLAIDFVPADPDEVIRFVVAPARAPADGATRSTFTVEVSPDLPAASRAVTFTSAAGLPLSPASPVPVGADGRASVDLTSATEIGSDRVTATVQGVSRSAEIELERAPPDVITVSADMLAVPAAPDSRVMVTATLRRDVGDVTDGTVVTFSAVDDTGASVGSFGNVTLSQGGTATATFLPGAAAPGFVTIFVGAEGTPVTGSLRIELTP